MALDAETLVELRKEEYYIQLTFGFYRILLDPNWYRFHAVWWAREAIFVALTKTWVATTIVQKNCGGELLWDWEHREVGVGIRCCFVSCMYYTTHVENKINLYP